jgi:hypothetical protein
VYEEYPTFDFLFPKVKKRRSFLKEFFKFYLNLRYNYGELYGTSDDLEGIIGWSNSKIPFIITKQMIFSGISLLFRYKRQFIKKLFSLAPIFTEKKIEHMIGPYWILGPFGVAVNDQNNGYGKMLLEFICDQADKKGKSIYLQTHKDYTRSLFSRAGFKSIEEIIIPNTSIIQWSMLREPL